MRELSLHILDIAENSVKAGATLIKITIAAENGRLIIEVNDNGKGMSRDFLEKVCDPFVTTRTTRKVGMGIPLFKQAAETAGGFFDIQSEEGAGTTVRAEFEIDNIDRAPMGDLAATVLTQLNNDIDYVWTYKVDDRVFVFDTREVKKQLGGVPIDSPEIVMFIKELLSENIQNTNGGTIL